MVSIFPDKPIYKLIRILPYAWVRNYFVRKIPAPQAFTWKQTLTHCKKRVVLLPVTLNNLATFLPFLMHLHRITPKGNLLLICPKPYESLLKGVGLDKSSLFFDLELFRFREPQFNDLILKLSAFKGEVFINLEKDLTLPMQFLIAKSEASLRISQNCVDLAPFLNISIDSPDSQKDYYLNKLYKLFDIQDSPIDHPLFSRSEQLSSSQVILLNLEDSKDGASWSESDLSQLVKQLNPHYRILALGLDRNQEMKYQKLLERLSIRSAPTASSYVVFLEMLKQYRGMISLRSAHAELAMQLSHIPMVILHNPSDVSWIPANSTNVFAIPKTSPLPNDLFKNLIK